VAKDPAFLFYPSDFLIGTVFMTDEQVGRYVKLLCYQHQMGPLKEEDMLAVCKTKDEKIFSKFKKDENGLYYNERLDLEATKRRSFCKSRKDAIRMRYVRSDYVVRTVNENENDKEQQNTTIDIKTKYMEYVFLTQGQYDQLAQKLGEVRVKEYIEKLNNYIGSKGKRYKSHYHTILSWSAKDGGIKSSSGVVERSDWRRYSLQTCSMCRGSGEIYAPGSGTITRCGCYKNG
jgi:hypothetical protein